MSCPKCNSSFYGPADRIIGVQNHCLICGHIEVTPLEEQKPMTLEQFKYIRPNRRSAGEEDPCPVIGCSLGVPKGKKLAMCYSCANLRSRWTKRGRTGEPPVFKNAEGKWERRNKQ